MSGIVRFAAAGMGALALLAVPAATAAPILAESGTYRVENGHTQVVFGIVHLGMSIYYGRFNTVGGTLQFNKAEPANSTVAIAIDTASIDTPSEKLDDELRAQDAFNVEQFPEASFRSTSIELSGENTGKIAGDLTIRGVTKPVTIEATMIGSGKHPFTDKFIVGFSGKAAIKRSDFGMTTMRWAPAVADEVELLIEAEFIQDWD